MMMFESSVDTWTNGFSLCVSVKKQRSCFSSLRDQFKCLQDPWAAQTPLYDLREPCERYQPN